MIPSVGSVMVERHLFDKSNGFGRKGYRSREKIKNNMFFDSSVDKRKVI